VTAQSVVQQLTSKGKKKIPWVTYDLHH